MSLEHVRSAGLVAMRTLWARWRRWFLICTGCPSTARWCRVGKTNGCPSDSRSDLRRSKAALGGPDSSTYTLVS